MRKPRRASLRTGLLAGLAALGAGALAGPAAAVHEKIVVRPMISLTQFVGAGDDSDVGGCALFDGCNASVLSGLIVPEIPPQAGAVLVGFDYFSFKQEDVCPCSGWGSFAYRGEIDFNTFEIPHQFVSATLVLRAVAGAHDSSHAFSDNLVTQLFEVAPGFPLVAHDNLIPVPPFAGMTLNIAFGATGDRITVVEQQPAGFGPIGPNRLATLGNPLVTRVGGRDYRIDVTDRVQKWVADWGNRGQHPLHGFVLVGSDETVPTDGNTNAQLWVMYQATLEFDVDEPDR
jgi:hypothetical protein